MWLQAFSGEGQRLDGKLNKSAVISTDSSSENKRGVPNYNYKKGRINFIRSKALVGQTIESMVSCDPTGVAGRYMCAALMVHGCPGVLCSWCCRWRHVRGSDGAWMSWGWMP